MTTAMVLRPQSFNELSTFAQMAAKTQLVPRDYQQKPENIMVAVQMGSEIGLAPMQALQNIAVVNGRPAVWGDAMLALCKAHPLWGGIKEIVESEGEGMRAVCQVNRKGDNAVTVTFSVEDAKRAGLWGKSGPWQQYPKRMLQMRARGFALRDAFPDALKGLISAEEAQDIPADSFNGPTIEAKADVIEEAPRSVQQRPDTPVEPPEEAARRVTDELLAKIENCAHENALHDLRGAMRTQAVLDRLSVKFPAMQSELTEAFTVKFNNFLAEGIPA